MRSSIALFLVLFCCFGQEPSVIRVDVRLVNVTFSVRDAQGTLVTNLTKDDFEALDDGVPQTIAFFARSADLPLTLGLIVDMSASQEHFMKQHRHDLQEFLKDVLTPRDRAFLICFGNRLRVASDFSASADELADGLKRFEHDSHSMPEIGPPDSRDLGTAFYDSLYYSITEKLAKAEGARKAIIMFSDG
jgi:Ca-activated chloride channel family protein